MKREHRSNRGRQDSASAGEGGANSGPSAAETATFEQLLEDAQRFMTAGFTPGNTLGKVFSAS